MPAAKDAEIYSCHPFGTTGIYPFSTEESWGLLGRITVKHNSINVCKVFSLLEMCDSLGGSQFLGHWYFRDVLGRDQGRLELRDSLLFHVLALPVSAHFYLIHIHLSSPYS